MIFEPRTFVEGLLRPLIIADPVTYVYFETMAPEIKFAALVFLFGALLMSKAMRARMQPKAWRALSITAVMFYAWTFTSGNGRYFISGLMLAGPVVVMLAAVAFKKNQHALFAVSLLLAVQLTFTITNYAPGQMAKSVWIDGQGLLVEQQKGDKPAIYISVKGNTYSAMIPSFNPASRWINLVGQSNIKPGGLEYDQYVEVLRSNLPINIVIPMWTELDRVDSSAKSVPPSVRLKDSIESIFSRYSLHLTGEDCRVVRTQVRVLREEKPKSGQLDLDFVKAGFFICPAEKSQPAWPSYQRSDLDDVFSAIEKRCPKQFPIGLGNERIAGNFAARYYGATDSILTISIDKRVRYEAALGFGSQHIGTVSEIREGRFELACEKFERHYMPPWKRTE